MLHVLLIVLLVTTTLFLVIIWNVLDWVVKDIT